MAAIQRHFEDLLGLLAAHTILRAVGLSACLLHIAGIYGPQYVINLVNQGGREAIVGMSIHNNQKKKKKKKEKKRKKIKEKKEREKKRTRKTNGPCDAQATHSSATSSACRSTRSTTHPLFDFHEVCKGFQFENVSILVNDMKVGNASTQRKRKGKEERKKSRALRCALAITRAARELGVEVRVGMHTGECELIGADVGGMAVHIAARVAEPAGPGEVLVSGTVFGTVVGARSRSRTAACTSSRESPGAGRCSRSAGDRARASSLQNQKNARDAPKRGPRRAAS